MAVGIRGGWLLLAVEDQHLRLIDVFDEQQKAIDRVKSVDHPGQFPREYLILDGMSLWTGQKSV